MGEHRIGIDENGLGARLGPLLVTGVLAEVDERGARLLARKLPAKLRADLDDSKRLVSCHDVSLGEAWARALVGREARLAGTVAPATPEDLFERLSLEGRERLTRPCPPEARPQCWTATDESFGADPDLVARIEGHLAFLESRGVRLLTARCSTLCVAELNRLKAAGVNRFCADLHAMERLVLCLQEHAGAEIVGTLGKVGGINEYTRFWGPLGGRLHNVLEEGRARSAYRFPGLGELRFVRDADASDPLVMLASLVGKYLRELLMRRIGRHWSPGDEALPSGYHDPVTQRFVERTALLRKRRRLPTNCFERSLDPVASAPPARQRAPKPASVQADLFASAAAPSSPESRQHPVARNAPSKRPRLRGHRS
jgi:ribonuclease HII